MASIVPPHMIHIHYVSENAECRKLGCRERTLLGRWINSASLLTRPSFLVVCELGRPKETCISAPQELSNGGGIDTGRTISFSDAVITIAITLLALDL